LEIYYPYITKTKFFLIWRIHFSPSVKWLALQLINAKVQTAIYVAVPKRDSNTEKISWAVALHHEVVID
jgi:hypothetical protein